MDIIGDVSVFSGGSGITFKVPAGRGMAGITQIENVESNTYRYLGNIKAVTTYQVELFDADGVLKWKEEFNNLVVTEGLNTLLDATFKTGIATPLWYIGLIDGQTESSFDVSDIMTSHVGWIENIDYTEDRVQFVPGDPSNGTIDNSGNRAAFSIINGGNIAGLFLTDNIEKSGTDGLLYGEGAFNGGTRAVETGDIMRITVTIEVD